MQREMETYHDIKQTVVTLKWQNDKKAMCILHISVVFACLAMCVFIFHMKHIIKNRKMSSIKYSQNEKIIVLFKEIDKYTILVGDFSNHLLIMIS